MIYTVEDNETTYAIKGSLRSAKIYADWLLGKGKAVTIWKRHLVKVSEVKPDLENGQPRGLFDDSYRVDRIYKKIGDKWV